MLDGFGADVKAAGLAVQLVELHFPSVEFGLPDGCENLDMIQSKNLFLNFMEACAALQEPLMAYLREQQRSPPSCIISDMMHWWTGDIARELGIPRLTFSGFCGFSSLVRYKHKEANLVSTGHIFAAMIKYFTYRTDYCKFLPEKKKAYIYNRLNKIIKSMCALPYIMKHVIQTA